MRTEDLTVKNTKKLCLKSVSVSERSGASITQTLTELKLHTGKQVAETKQLIFRWFPNSLSAMFTSKLYSLHLI